MSNDKVDFEELLVDEVNGLVAERDYLKKLLVSEVASLRGEAGKWKEAFTGKCRECSGLWLEVGELRVRIIELERAMGGVIVATSDFTQGSSDEGGEGGGVGRVFVELSYP
jgi:hypothetical protein